MKLERVLFTAFFITFIVMIFVQAAMINPSIRTFITSTNEYEGAPLGVEEYLYSQGELGLKLVNAESNDNLKVLVNGDQVAAFTSRGVSLKVKNGDVVEIDGSNVDVDSVVGIVSKSANITTDCVNKTVNVKLEVKRLVKVKIEEQN